MDNPYYSQFGEDRLLARMFPGAAGRCLEVGANDGINDSNTYHFELAGWQCVLVEPNPWLCEEIRKKRKARLFECAASDASGRAVLNVARGAERSHGVSSLSAVEASAERIAAFGFVSEPVNVGLRTLDSMLEESMVGPGFEFMSIDVEGHELAALRGFTLSRWQPKVVIVESNGGALSPEIAAILDDGGYRRFFRTGVNIWYRRGDFQPPASPGYWVQAWQLRLRAAMQDFLATRVGAAVRRTYRMFLKGERSAS